MFIKIMRKKMKLKISIKELKRLTACAERALLEGQTENHEIHFELKKVEDPELEAVYDEMYEVHLPEGKQ